MEDLIEAYLSVYEESDIDEGFKRMNRDKIEKQAKRLGGDRGDVLRIVADKMDTEAERKYSTSQARKNRAGAGSEYRKAQELRARDDAKADFKKYGLPESVDLYDLVLDHLLDEGYADTEENAITIMANMSEEWIDEIIDEAQIMSVSSPGGKKKYQLPTNIDRIQTALQRLKDKKNETRNRAGEEENQRHTRNAIQQMNANPGTGSASADHGGAGDKTGRFYHYNLKGTDHIARRRRASGR